MNLLEKEIREQPSVLASVKEKNISAIRKIASDFHHEGLTGIYFAARGTSDHACIFAQYLFAIKSGIVCTLGTPSVISKYGADMSYGNALVIGVSQSGCAEDVLSVLRQANSDGKITVAITNHEESPMAQTAKYHLFCNAGEERSIAATKTFTAEMYLLSLLCAEIAKDAALSSLLEKIPAAMETVLSSVPAQLDCQILRYRYLNNAFVLGRGMVYPIALEGALKMLETNKIPVKGNAISDFYHGPIAQIDDGTLTIVLAAEGPVYDDSVAMIQKLHDIGAEVFVITDHEALAEKEPLSLVVPSLGSDIAASYLMAVCMQLFALKLTEVKGIDPNGSGVLHKVTITV